MPKNSISRKVLTMNDLTNKKNVQHNDLITSVAKMDKTPLKIFELAVSCIDPKNPPKDNAVYLSKQDLFSFFNVSDSNKHSRFKQAIEKMQKQAYFVVSEQTNKGLEFESIVPIPYIKWNDNNDEVMIEFNRHIMPYLIELKQDFTQYAISDIIELNSKYSIILYKWLSMNYNQYEHYQFKGNRTNKQLESLHNPTIRIEELRRMTDTVNEYPRFTNFDNYVIKNSLKEINEHTHFKVTYEKLKKGRSIESIQFHIEKKQVVKNEFYKEEQQDTAYLQGKEDKEQEFEGLYATAMESPYTEILSDNTMIGLKDFRDIQVMGSMQKMVYPLYDELKQLRGIEEVKKHISYVASRKEDYSNTNIVKYLHTAITNYLVRVNKEKGAEKLPEQPEIDYPKPSEKTKKRDTSIYYNWLEDED